ncbi:hypothetical protein H0H81_008703 [Sphagnurus paluster]|uniref:WHIM2 domain-containing protein n=1 Tax=Sphagnurus paluster TaxID=117069 RepID=A0A9P7KIY4_9AGAR|nr:hypothetical protein H0H81_008703 [Sphagnurus paluster]
MSDYDIRPGGSLKLKGGVAEGGIVKKKKKKSKSKSDSDKNADREKIKNLLFREDDSRESLSGSGSSSPVPGSSSSSRKTEAEKRFEEVQKRRLEERVAKLATKTHKDRVNEFNNHLESLSEHHDIPKAPSSRFVPQTCPLQQKVMSVRHLMQLIPQGAGKYYLSTPSSANSLHFGGRWTDSKHRWSASGPQILLSFHGPASDTEALVSSLEEALMLREPNELLSQVLQHFILNLKPQTRNLSEPKTLLRDASTDQISATVAAVLADYFKSSERTIFWNDDLRMNIDPFEGLEGGFFTADWDFKLKILRQLVELQLSHNVEIKAIIDRAWGVSQNKHKKKDAATAPPDPSDPKSQESLQLVPIGQDSRRKRYWIADGPCTFIAFHDPLFPDSYLLVFMGSVLIFETYFTDSPRVFASTNPWKITATFQTVSSTQEEYLALVEELKASAPRELKKGEKRTKLEHAHIALIAALEKRIEVIDAEITRVARVRKRIEQREYRKLMAAQMEVRETRTRRQTQKPDYVYNNTYDSEEDADEYTYQDDGPDEDFDEEDFLNFRDAPNGSGRRRAAAPQVERRRSTRTAVAKLNVNGKRESSSESWSQWRGERRSSRLGGPGAELDVDPPPKRARTEDSTMSTNSADGASTSGATQNNLKIKISGAAALKPTEIALEQIAGKKRSKFWVYAVEPIPDGTPASQNSAALPSRNGHGANGHSAPRHSTSPSRPDNGQMDIDGDLKGSLSPMDP